MIGHVKMYSFISANVDLTPTLVIPSRFILPGGVEGLFLLSGLLVLPSWLLFPLQLICILAVLLNGHKQFRIIFLWIIIAMSEDYRKNRLKNIDIKKW